MLYAINHKSIKNLFFYISISICLYGCSPTKPLINNPYDDPEFPLPPPQPSASDNISNSKFNNCTTISQINDTLIKAMEECGYTRRSYFYVPNGFALVT